MVDDEPDVRLLVGLQLRAAGLDVVGEAGDGAAALDVCEQQRPDVVVFDILMPGMTGFAAIPALQEALPGTGIVAYTSIASDFVREEMARLGVPLVVKAGDPQPLIDAIQGIVSRPT